MRALRRLARPAVATTAAVLLLAGCGGDDGDDGSFTRPSTTASTTTSSAPTGGDADIVAFCQQAAAFVQAAGDLQGLDPAQLPGALQQAVVDFDAIQPPTEIAADWQVVGTALHTLADTAGSLDVATDQGAAALQQAFLTFAQVFQSPQGRNISGYVTAHCTSG